MNVTKQRSLVGHTNAINAVRYTSDGSYCMTCSDDRSVRLWNPHKDDPAAEGNALLVKTYSGTHGYQIFDVAISSDKTKFATAGGDRVSFLWDVSSGRVIRRLQGHSQRINTAHLNDAGTLLYTGSYDNTVCVWDLKSGMREPVQTLTDFRDSVTSVSTTRHEVVASSVDGDIRIYDIRMGQLSTDSLGLPITHIQIREDGKSVAASCLGGDLHLCDISSGRVMQRYSGRVHDAYKLDSSFCPDATHICGASEDGMVRVWNLVTGSGLRVSVSPQAHTMGSVQHSKPAAADAADNSKMHSRAIYTVACNPKHNYFVTGCSDGSAACWSYSFDQHQ